MELENQYRTRFVTVDPDELKDPDDLKQLHTLTPKDFTHVEHQPKIIDQLTLKRREDGEIYLADNAPDFLFKDFEKKMKAALNMTYEDNDDDNDEAKNDTNKNEASDEKENSFMEVEAFDIIPDFTLGSSKEKNLVIGSEKKSESMTKSSNHKKKTNKKSSHQERTKPSEDSPKEGLNKSSHHHKKKKNKYKDNPLHSLLKDYDPTNSKHKLDEDKIQLLVNEQPTLFCTTYEFDHILNGDDTMYPLHMILCMGGSLSLIKHIYKVCNGAIEYKTDPKDMTCLHYAVMYTRSSLDVIQYILHKCPDMIYSINKKKQTPLHLACMCSSKYKFYNPEVIMLLSEIGSKQLTSMVDKHGRTALHIACGIDDPCLAVIEDLTEVDNQACIKQCTNYQSTPLHIACSSNMVCDENNIICDIIKDLIRSNSNAVQITDSDGNIPIFVAIQNNACLKVCKMLVKKYPECLEMKDPDDGLLLYEIAKSKKLDQDIIDFLYPYEEDDDE